MRRLLPLIAIGVLIAGCAHVRHPKSGPLALGPADTGRTVIMAVGQVAIVRLASNPGTGYRWQSAADPDARVLIIVDNGYDRPPENPPGAPGEAWWKLRATGAGKTAFAVRYVRPWEPDVKAKEFTVTITVK